MIRPAGTLAVLVALVCPGLGLAQSYPFETLARGIHSGPNDSPARLLIQSEQELQQSGVDRLLPPGTSVDFASEAVIAVKMGSRPTGGYAIEVREIDVQPSSGSTPGGPSVSLTTVLNVKVFSRSPGPGELVTQAFTAPYHVVKVQRPPLALAATFEDLGTAVDFDGFRRSEGSMVHATSIEVLRSGEVTIHERAIGSFDVTQRTGQASPARIEQLRRALAQADFAGLPADLGNDPQLMDAPGVSYVLSQGGTDTVKSGTLTLIAPALRARLQTVDAALDAIRADLFAQLPTFDSLSFTTRTPEGSDTLIRTLTIQADGSARVDQRYLLREISILPVAGTVDSATLDQLALRIRLARVSSLPGQLPTPVHVTTPETFSLEVASQNPDNAGATAGEPGYYEAYQVRLERLVSLLIAQRDQVIQSGTPVGDDAFKGEVVVQGGEVILRGPQASLTLRGDLARTIREFPGETVKVSGQRSADELTVTAILYPERATVSGVSAAVAGRPHVVTQGVRAPASGAAARVLARLGARDVEVDGWVFKDFNTQQITRVHVEGVAATVRRTSVLTLSGAFQGIARRGEAVQIRALSSSGRFVRVSAPGGEGYLRLSRLTVGSEVQPQPGLSGSLPQ